MQRETWRDDKELTANYGASYDRFGGSAAISIYIMLVGDYEKDEIRLAAYSFLLSVYGSWDEGTRLIQINEIFSGYLFGYVVALSGDISLIGAHGTDEKGYDSGTVYIFCRMYRVWQD